MENIGKDLISILQYLLPGFLAAWVFYGLTSVPKPSQFERVVQALIFTLIIQAGVFLEKSAVAQMNSISPFCSWSTRAEVFCSIFTACFLGCLLAYFTNSDKLHKLARKVGLTKETSYPSEWFGTFLKNVTYVVLHLEDERRLYGWPIEWPSEPDKGHFVLEQASWLDGDREIALTGVNSIMVMARDVKWVEFMDKTWEVKNGEEST